MNFSIRLYPLGYSCLSTGSAHTRKLSQSSVEQYVPSFGHSPTMAASSKRRTRHKLRPETTLKPGGRELDSKDWMSENRSQYLQFADETLCDEELKHALLALNCDLPGMSTFITLGMLYYITYIPYNKVF